MKKITVAEAEKAVLKIRQLVTSNTCVSYLKAFNWYSKKRALVFQGMYKDLLPYLNNTKALELLGCETWITAQKNIERNEDIQRVQEERMRTLYKGDPDLYRAACGLDPYP